MRKFFEMNDTDVLIVAALYFTSVIGGWIYCCKKWSKEEKERGEKNGKKRNSVDRRRNELLKK